MNNIVNSIGSIFVLVTGRCNLACLHCYVSSSPTGAVGLCDDRWREFRDEMLALEESIHISISGGEPLTRRELTLELIDGLSPMHRIALLTNATLIDAPTAKRLTNSSVSVRVSLDGDRVSHDEIRGVGTYERATRGIHALLDGGFPPQRLSLHCALRPGDERGATAVLQFAEERGIPTVRFDEMRALGRGFINWSTLVHGRMGGWLEAAIDSLGQAGWSTEPLADADTDNLRHLNIYPDGDVYVSAVAHPHDRIGNIAQQSLMSIMQDTFQVERSVAHRFWMQVRGNANASPTYLLRWSQSHK